MKIQCNACEAAEAKVLCCADEAALCLACDERVHAANKLAGKHQRVHLTGSSSQVPKCDICKEASGYFFCLEDRALLCRKCDVAIHTANSFVSAHQRFLLTGVKVGSETSENVISLAEQQPVPFSGNTESSSKSLHDKKSSSMSLSAKNSQVVSNNTGNNGGLHASKVSCPPIMTGGAPEWPPEDFFDFANFSQSYGYIEHESSKADSGKVGSLEGSPVYASAGEELGIEFVGQVPEIPWTVPEIPSPPTASGLNWPKYSDRSLVEDSAYVPDISSSYSDMQWGHYSSTFPKRRRRS